MAVNNEKVGEVIADLRRGKGITQNELGERLGVSPQSVSKWERGETLPDSAILPDLAAALETSIDYILTGGEKIVRYKRRVRVADIREGIESFEKIGHLLGKNSTFYLGAIEGINRKMNIAFEEYMADSFSREAMIAEAVIQAILNGDYVDLSDVRKSFAEEHWVKVITDYANRHGIV